MCAIAIQDILYGNAKHAFLSPSGISKHHMENKDTQWVITSAVPSSRSVKHFRQAWNSLKQEMLPIVPCAMSEISLKPVLKIQFC